VERLAMLLSDWPAAGRGADCQGGVLVGDEERASTWRRIGEAKRDMLDDAAGAVEAYERAYELEPASAFPWTA
jgi:hypothetical protein